MKPIIFNTESARAILEGRKTQTRRVIKYAVYAYLNGKDITPEDLDVSSWINLCPYGQVGDKLWVRETFRSPGGKLEYAADIGVDFTKKAGYYAGYRWHPSIHMPRWASRITLEITEIRVERLQEISFEDAKAEGILRFDSGHRDINGGMGYNRGAPNLPMRYESTAAFMDLWDSINGKKHPWSSNPWVWVISFKMLIQEGR